MKVQKTRFIWCAAISILVLDVCAQETVRVNSSAKTHQSKHLSLKTSFHAEQDGSRHRLKVYSKPGNDVPAFIDFEKPAQLPSKPNMESEEQVVNASKAIVKGLEAELHINNPTAELKLSSIQRGQRSTHASFDQYYKGIPIYGSELKVHFNQKGELTRVNGNTISTPSDLNLIPQFTSNEIIQKVEHRFGQSHGENSDQFGYFHPSAELVIYNESGRQELCWKVNYFEDIAHNWELIISASTGDELLSSNQVCSGHPLKSEEAYEWNNAKSRQTPTSVHTYYSDFHGEYILFNGSEPEVSPTALEDGDYRGGMVIFNANKGYPSSVEEPWFTSPNNIWGEPNNTSTSATPMEAALACQNHMSAVFDYYSPSVSNPNQKWIGDYRGLDGENSTTIRAWVNVGSSYENAFWAPGHGEDGGMMVFGRGGSHNHRLCASRDIVAHEYTHGVIQHLVPGIINSGQTGAINEALADIMALTIAQHRGASNRLWKFGQDAVDLAEGKYANGCWRNIAEPHGTFKYGDEGYHYNHVNEILDKGHPNYDKDLETYRLSTIISHAFYQLVENSVEQGEQLDMHRMAAMFFNAMRHYFPKNGDFVDFARGVKYAFMDEFPHETHYAIKAFEKVGIYLPEEDYSNFNIPAVDGESFLLANRITADPRISAYDPSTLNEERNILHSISIPKDAVSVTDNGKMGFYIDQNGKVVRLSFNTDSLRNIYAEQTANVLDQEWQKWKWTSVAVSPRGKRLALAKENDSKVHVYDIETNRKISFQLSSFYSLSDGTAGDVPAQPIKVGNITWNFDGDQIMFDCASVPLGSEISEENFHWNIARMTVWDTVKNQVNSQAEIDAPIYGSLLPHLHLRNPKYAKNSPGIIVWDEFDSKKNRNIIFSYNQGVARDGIRALDTTPILAYPCYSYNDKQLVYTTLNLRGDTILQRLTLNQDKTSSNGKKVPLVVNRKSAVWITVGTRRITKTLTEGAADVFEHLDAVPFDDDDKESEESASFGMAYIYDLNGRIVHSQHLETPEEAHAINLSTLNSGIYVLKIRGENAQYTKKIIKQ